MTRYLIRRLMWALVVLFAATVVIYVIFFVLPADPAQSIAGQSNSPEAYSRAKHLIGLDQPVWVQYARFLRRIFIDHDLGYSFADRSSVGELLRERAPVTLSLVIGGAVLSLAFSVVLGTAAAMRPRMLLGRVASLVPLVGVAVHPIWLGLISLYLFAYRLHWAPLGSYCPIAHGVSCHGLSAWASHLILPWTTFAVINAAIYVRMLRASMLEVADEDYVRTARAKGASERRTAVRHVLRNSLIPVITIFSMNVGVALTGVIFIEAVYSLPGIGRAMQVALLRSDVPVIEGVVLLTTLIVVGLNLLVDVAYAYIDPRIRL